MILDVEITGIPVHDFVIFADQLLRFGYVMDIGGGAGDGVDVSASGVHSGMDLHPEIQLVALPGLVHLLVTLILFVLGRTWGSNDGGINYGAPMHYEA